MSEQARAKLAEEGDLHGRRVVAALVTAIFDEEDPGRAEAAL